MTAQLYVIPVDGQRVLALLEDASRWPGAVLAEDRKEEIEQRLLSFFREVARDERIGEVDNLVR